jgi:hypothetical protein
VALFLKVALLGTLSYLFTSKQFNFERDTLSQQ